MLGLISRGGTTADEFVSADVNSDGVLDIVVASENTTNPITVFLGVPQYTVDTITPSQNAIDIATNSTISLVFSDSLNIGTVNQTNLPIFSAERGILAGSYSFSTTTNANDTVIFDPTTSFRTGEQIVVSVTSSVLSNLGSSTVPFSSSFTAATAGGNFTVSGLPPVSIAGGTPEKLFHADLNGDNFVDIAAINSSSVFLLINDGVGGLTHTGTIPIGADQLTGGDFNGDGTVDLAISNNASNRIDIYTNNGSAIFSAFSNVATADRPYGATVNDFDGDGDLDLIVGDQTTEDANVLLNDGSANFTNTQTINEGLAFWGATSGDFDGDGDMDAALAADNSSSILLLTNDGSATFTTTILGTAFTVQNISSGDIDGDGDIDLFAGSTTGGQFQINNGSGGFTNGAMITGGAGQYRDHMFGDIDGDGDLDLIVSRLGTVGISYFSNDGTGTFLLEQTFTTDINTPDGVVLTDMDNDGDLDATYVSRNLETVTVLLNQGISDQGGGGTFTQLSQPAEQGSNIPLIPSPIGGIALDQTSIRWDFHDNSGLETGFELVDNDGNILQTINTPNSVSILEENLEPNTKYELRRVRALGDIGNSDLSEPFGAATTLAPAFDPLLSSASPSSVTITVDQPFPNLEEGQSALNFELIISTAATAAAAMESGWIQDTEYTFEGLEPGQEYQVRVNARNQDGIETGFSPFTDPATIPFEDQVLFDVSLGATYVGGEVLPFETLDPKRNIQVNVALRNTGNIPATNVLLNVPVPAHMRFIGGSLFVNSDFQSSDADQDIGQGNQNAVSVIWPIIEPGQSATISFQLGFDLDSLRAFQSRETATADAINELAGLGDVLAAANPVITLEASVNSTETPDAFVSSSVVLEPDLELLPDEEEEGGMIPTIDEPAPTAPPGGGNTPADDSEEEVLQDDTEEVEEEVIDELILTSEVDANEETLIFMGTTSEPNTIVLVTIVSQVFEVLSDENGVWELLVTAEQLGIEPGEAQTIMVQSIAQKGDISSNIVAQDLFVQRQGAGEIIVETEAFVGGQSEIVASVQQVAQFVEEQEDEVQATLAVVAPVVVVASAPLLGYLPFIPSLLIHGFTSLLGIAGRRRKERRYYGIVYDSVSKEPLALAIVRIYNNISNKLVATQVTDKQGRYDLLVQQGNYRLEVTKPGFSFPTAIVDGQNDGIYQQLYQVQEPLVIGEEVIAPPDIPLDPVNVKKELSTAGALRKIGVSVQHLGKWIVLPVLFVGFVFSLFLLVNDTASIVNWIYAILYGLLLLLQLRLRPVIEKAWGVVYETTTGAVLPLTTIQLIDPQVGKIVKSRLSDYQGRFSFLSQPGNYIIKANKNGFEQVGPAEAQDAYHHPLSEEVTITKENEHLTGDIAMKQL